MVRANLIHEHLHRHAQITHEHDHELAGHHPDPSIPDEASHRSLEGASKMTAIDLVCKMEVDIDSAPAQSEYKGMTYYFCAPGCKKAFEQSPEKLVND
jgi:YHS domain-containing protein